MLWYATGNLSKDQASQITGEAVELMNLQSIPKEELADSRVVNLSTTTGQFDRLDFTVADKSNENSCLVSYYQYGIDDGQNGGKLDLLNDLAIQFMDEPTFDQLRTKEQLGYVVFSRARVSRDILSAWFLIQSPQKDCMYIRTRLDLHLQRMRKKVHQLSDEDFTTVVGAVMTSISEKDKNLNEEFGRFWRQEMSTHKYDFDRQENQIAMLKTITKTDLQDYFEKLFFQDGRANRLDMHWNSQS